MPEPTQEKIDNLNEIILELNNTFVKTIDLWNSFEHAPTGFTNVTSEIDLGQNYLSMARARFNRAIEQIGSLQ